MDLAFLTHVTAGVDVNPWVPTALRVPASRPNLVPAVKILEETALPGRVKLVRVRRWSVDGAVSVPQEELVSTVSLVNLPHVFLPYAVVTCVSSLVTPFPVDVPDLVPATVVRQLTHVHPTHVTGIHAERCREEESNVPVPVDERVPAVTLFLERVLLPCVMAALVRSSLVDVAVFVLRGGAV